MKSRKLLNASILLILFAALLILELFSKKIFVGHLSREYVYPMLTRVIAGTACFVFLLKFGMPHILVPRVRAWHMAIFLPCMLIAINNFPIIPFFSGEAYINTRVLPLLLYALLCLSVGFFEEMAFRGCIFTAVLARLKNKRAGVFWSIVVSSAIFGIIHLLNILNGASPSATILQVGYSFLIGGMCSVILVKTQNIWYCVILHAVYNFAGGAVPQLGGGEIWTIPEIILTVAVSIPVAAYVIFMLARVNRQDINKTLNPKGEKNDIC